MLSEVVDYDSLARRLKTMRKAAGLSMKQLAARLDYSYQWVDNVEGGRRKPDITDIERFAKECGYSVVFEIVAPGEEPRVLARADVDLVEAARDLSDRDREGLIEAARLVADARHGAWAAALAVLRNLQEQPTAVASEWRAVGDPD